MPACREDGLKERQQVLCSDMSIDLLDFQGNGSECSGLGSGINKLQAGSGFDQILLGREHTL